LFLIFFYKQNSKGITMNKPYCALTKATSIFVLSISLIACGGGGGSSTGGGGSGGGNTPQYISNFTQLTPNGGVLAPQIQAQSDTLNVSTMTDYFAAIAMAKNGTLYIGTYQGAVHQIINANNGFATLGNQLVNPSTQINTIMALGADQNSYSYITLNSPYLSQGTGFPVAATTPISTITFGDNLLSYYGTANGNVGIAQNPLAGIPRLTQGCSLPTPGQPTVCTIAGISKASSYLFDSKNTLIALQFNKVGAPVFETQKAANRNWDTGGFFGSLSCLRSDNNTWTMIPTSNGILPQDVRTFNYTDASGTHQATELVPQHITSMIANTNGKIYAATNLLDVYENTIDSNCNSGATWTKVNTAPLGALQDGLIGITSLGLVDGKIIAVVNYSNSIMAYRSNTNNY
jgi:hypothetical protein